MLASPRQAPISRTILVVDDHVDFRGLLRALIERGPHRVVEAGDGDDALALIARAAPDLILLDMNLPTVDGVAVCRRVKSDPATRAIPVVMLTPPASTTCATLVIVVGRSPARSRTRNGNGGSTRAPTPTSPSPSGRSPCSTHSTRTSRPASPNQPAGTSALVFGLGRPPG
jgi:CheY-like chemotaxis protein